MDRRVVALLLLAGVGLVSPDEKDQEPQVVRAGGGSKPPTKPAAVPLPR